jgi:hypothetical protein
MFIQSLKSAAEWLMPNNEASTVKKVAVALPLLILSGIAKVSEISYFAFKYLRGTSATAEKTDSVATQIFHMIGKTKTAATASKEPLLSEERTKQEVLKTYIGNFDKAKVSHSARFSEDQMSEIHLNQESKPLFILSGPNFMTRAKELGKGTKGFEECITTPQEIKIFDQLTRDFDRFPVEIEFNGSKEQFPNQPASPKEVKEARISEVCGNLLEKLGGPSEENKRLVETAMNTVQQALLVDYMLLINKSFRPGSISQELTMPPISFKVTDGKIEISQKATYKVLDSKHKMTGKVELSINYTVENKAGVPTISDVSYGLKKTASK